MNAIWIDRGTRIFSETDEQNLSWVTICYKIYIDDVLIHSINREMHKTHLEQVFQRIKEAGLTPKGCKCRIRKDEVIYLGHVFCGRELDLVVTGTPIY